jgi:DNA modification methylase
MSVRIINADVCEGLRTLEAETVHCCVTSPPYWGMRDYGVDGQIGLEKTPEAFISKMVEVFREVKRVLRSDGTAWVNMGDGYASAGGAGWQGKNGERATRTFTAPNFKGNSAVAANLKPKDLIGMPWMLAFALRADGWWLRQEIIWHKPNPMPESCADRCTKAHEHIFLLSKSERYAYDADAIREGRTSDEDADGFRGGSYVGGQPGKRAIAGNKRVKVPGGWDRGEGAHGTIHRDGRTSAEYQEAPIRPGRNKRSVWTIATQAFSEAHFATFPEELAETCIKAGCPVGGTVLDPFGGAGTTGLVADKLGRNAVLIELNPEYAAMAERRIRGDCPMFSEVT